MQNFSTNNRSTFRCPRNFHEICRVGETDAERGSEEDKESAREERNEGMKESGEHERGYMNGAKQSRLGIIIHAVK